MQLTVIGSGTAALRAERGLSGYVLRNDEELYLLDGGSGTLKKCAEAGISYKAIDKIFYTHLHPDHTTDLVPFLFATKHTPGFLRTNKLEIYGPVGFTEFFRKVTDVYGVGLTEVDYELETTEMSRDRLTFEDLRVETNLMQHAKNAIGYRFTADNRVFVYSGDTDYCEEIIALARDADLLLLECSFPDHMKVAGHLTPTEAGRVAQKAGAKRLLLTHLYPPCDEEDILTACRRGYDGRVELAYDLMQVNI